ncbi:MAG TPA: DUF3307 domain-containing protein [Flavisolibacter sp.]|nr:DUF3307 domain-containing protein [Flavisolibacter sp.]
MTLFLQLFLAHIIGDFFLQPSGWVLKKEARKWASFYLYLHAAVHFLLLLLFTGVMKQNRGFDLGILLGFWLPALVIAVLHLVIDGCKLQFQTARTKRTWFFADQLMHLGVIFGVWIWIEKISLDPAMLSNVGLLAPLTAILFMLKPTSLIIRIVISKWQPGGAIVHTPLETDITGSNTGATNASLENAGELIGMLERLIIIIFILLGKWEGVGFLLAAKSVFRFGDLREARDRKLTEYVLIGTLLSFGIAIITGIVTVRLLS